MDAIFFRSRSTVTEIDRGLDAAEAEIELPVDGEKPLIGVARRGVRA